MSGYPAKYPASVPVSREPPTTVSSRIGAETRESFASVTCADVERGRAGEIGDHGPPGPRSPETANVGLLDDRGELVRMFAQIRDDLGVRPPRLFADDSLVEDTGDRPRGRPGLIKRALDRDAVARSPDRHSRARPRVGTRIHALTFN